MMININELSEIFVEQLFYNLPEVHILPFGSNKGLKHIKNIIFKNRLEIDIIEEYHPNFNIINQLKIIPEFIAIEEYDETTELVYYIKILFVNFLKEHRVSKFLTKNLKSFYPNTIIIIVTPHNNVFYAVKVDEIVSGKELDLDNYPIQNFYKFFTSDKETRVILENLQRLFKQIIRVVKK